MGEQANSLPMTVHLLASSGDAILLQQILDQLFHGLWPDIQLFLISERVTSLKYFERYPKKMTGFPGMSILLFLHEDLGEERIMRTLHFFQQPPWQHHHTENANGRPCTYMLVSQDFYSLDAHMPVWGVRQVHYGTEILRVSLYCSFENYEDAVRLYEMILQKEATLEKSGFCFFLLHATENMCVQLSLKQMPMGMPLEIKESSALQFRVQDIGQLVPLLPNPCIPISHRRWQTQDYDGNKILLQVQGKTHEKHIFLPPQQKSPNEESSLHSGRHCDRSRESMDRNYKNFYFRADAKNRLFQAGKHQSSGEASDHSESLTSESPSGTPRTGSFCSSQSSSPANLAQYTMQSKMELSSQEKLIKTQEEETNVDTGFTVLLSECWPLPLVRFSRELQDSVPNHGRVQNLSSGEVSSRNNRMSENPSHNSFDAINKYKSCGTGTSQFRLMPTSTKHGNRVEEEEEFFI